MPFPSPHFLLWVKMFPMEFPGTARHCCSQAFRRSEQAAGSGRPARRPQRRTCSPVRSISPGGLLYRAASSPYRGRLHDHANGAGLRTSYPSGPGQSDRFFLGLEGHYLHLALLAGLVGSTSPGLEQVHPGRARTGLRRGLEIRGRQRLLLCALPVPWLPGGARGRHSPLLWPHSVFRPQGESEDYECPSPRLFPG